MSFPLIATFTLAVPPDEGLPPDELPFVMSTSAESSSSQKLTLTGSGTRTVDFGTIGGAGAKLVVVTVAQSVGAAPVFCRFNGGSTVGSVEIAPGGYAVLASPAPVAGNTALEIVHTTNVTVKVWIFG